MSMCLSACIAYCMYAAGTYTGQKRMLEPLDFELQAFVGCHIRVLGTKHRNSGRAASAFNLGDSTLA